MNPLGIDPSQVLFLDIETVPLTARFEALHPVLKAHWQKSAQRKGQTDSEAAAEYEAGAVKAEYGRVLCVALAMLQSQDGPPPTLKVTSFLEDDEALLLSKLARTLEHLGSREDNLMGGTRQVRWLCAHNGKEFDFPFLARRMVVQQVPLPKLLQVWGKKPWETPFLDTMELWKFGDYKSFTALEVLAALFGLPTPKEDMQGADVAHVYYQERNPDRIRRYCETDVATLVQVFFRLLQLPVLAPQDIHFSAG